MKSPFATRIYSPASVCIIMGCSFQYMTPVKLIYISTDPPHRFLSDQPPPSPMIQPLSSQVRSCIPPPTPFALTKRIVMRKIPLPCLLPQLPLLSFFLSGIPHPAFSSTTPIHSLAVTVCVKYPPPPSPFPIDFLCDYNLGSSLLYQSSVYPPAF